MFPSQPFLPTPAPFFMFSHSAFWFSDKVLSPASALTACCSLRLAFSKSVTSPYLCSSLSCSGQSPYLICLTNMFTLCGCFLYLVVLWEAQGLSHVGEHLTLELQPQPLFQSVLLLPFKKLAFLICDTCCCCYVLVLLVLTTSPQPHQNTTSLQEASCLSVLQPVPC